MSDTSNREALLTQIHDSLGKVNLSEEWQENFLYNLWWLETLDSSKVDEYLGKAGAQILELIYQKNYNPNKYQVPEALLIELTKEGACIQPVAGCFVLTDPDEITAIPAGGAEPMKPAEFAQKFADIITALRNNGIFAGDLTVYTGIVFDNMMRQAPYYLIDIPIINTQIAVCDQIGERTFYSQNRLSVGVWSGASKTDLQENHGVTGAERYNRKDPAGWANDFVTAAMTIGGVKINVEERERVKQPKADPKPLLPEIHKTEKWLSNKEFAGQLLIDNRHEKFSQFWEAAEKGEINWNPPLKCGYLKNGTRTAFYAHEDEVKRVAIHLGISIEEKTDNWLGRYELAAELVIHHNNEKLLQFLDDAEKGNIKWTPPLNGRLLKSGTRRIYCVNEDELTRVAEYLGVISEKKTEGWLAKMEFAQELGIASDNEVFETFWEAAKSEEIKWEPPLQGKRLRSDKRSEFYIYKDEVERVREHLGIISEKKTEGWLGKVAFGKEIGVHSSNKEFSDFWNQAEAGEINWQPPLKCQTLRSGTRPVFYIHADEADRIMKHLGIEKKEVLEKKTDGWLRKREFASELGTGDRNSKFSEFWSYAKSGNINWLPPLKCGLLESGGNTVFCIHESEVSRVKEYLAKQKDTPTPLITAADMEVNEGQDREPKGKRK